MDRRRPGGTGLRASGTSGLGAKLREVGAESGPVDLLGAVRRGRLGQARRSERCQRDSPWTGRRSELAIERYEAGVLDLRERQVQGFVDGEASSTRNIDRHEEGGTVRRDGLEAEIVDIADRFHDLGSGQPMARVA